MSDPWKRLQDAFEAARQLPSADRRPRLVDLLGDDSETIARVEAMLRADAMEELPIDRRLQTLADELLSDTPPAPERVGPYRIAGRLGAGGMGVVYRGVRPDLERTDAIKVLHGTSLSPVRRELFRREQRLLSSLRHPSIAQLHDAGTLDDGTPYFVMEEVAGLPLDEACERRRLPLTARLELFLKTCDAVQYAHARGVIHRDLKTSNLLVPDGDGPPGVKLLDFGIAHRPGDESDEDKDIGAYTPAYASPEQVRGDAATVSTDVYALGVLLFELLARDRPRPAAERLATPEADSPGPSSSATRLDDVKPLLWRELDAICARALALAPESRYATVDALAEEVRRVLDHRPVLALPAAPGYVARKLARRHRLAVAFAATVAILVVATTGVVFVQSRRVAAERDRTEIERAAAEQLSDFMLDLFQASDPARVRGRDVLARDLLDAAAATLRHSSADQPRDRVRFLYAISRAYDHLGLYNEQAEVLRAALDSPDVEQRRSPPSQTILHAELAGALLQLGDTEAAESILEKTPTDGPDGLAIETKIAQLRWMQGDLDEAEAIFLRAIPALEASDNGEHRQRYFECLANLGAVYSHQGRYDEAGALYERAIGEMTRRVGADHPSTLMQRGNLASLEIRRQRFAEAQALLTPLLADKRRVLGERHADTLRSVNGLAVVEHYLGHLDNAEALFREALAASEETLPAGHRDTLALVGNLAAVLVDQGEIDEGRALHLRAYEGFRRSLGERHRFTALVLHNLAGANVLTGRLDEADRQFGEVQAIWTETLPADHPNQSMNLDAWAEAQRRLGHEDRAADLEARANRIREAVPEFLPIA